MGNEKELKFKDKSSGRVKEHSEVVSESKTEARNKRKRIKFLTSQIRDQLEFYFGDANLRKDRFLKQYIEKNKDGLVDISILLSFNKLKSMTDDEKVIIRAAKASNKLKVSSDEKQIGRIQPLTPPKYDIDDVTVYVECIPPNATHEWLKSVFSCCGKVTYVSIPKYKSTNDIKGFAFVEFETPGEADRACQMLNNPPQDIVGRPGKFPKTRAGKIISSSHHATSEIVQNIQIRDRDRQDSFRSKDEDDKQHKKRVEEKDEHHKKRTGGEDGDDDGVNARKEEKQGKKRKRQQSEGEAQEDIVKSTKKREYDSDSCLEKKKAKKEERHKHHESQETDKPKGVDKKDVKHSEHRTSHVEHESKGDKHESKQSHDKERRHEKERHHETHAEKHQKHKRHHHHGDSDHDEASEKKRTRKHDEHGDDHDHVKHGRKRKHTDDLNRDELKRTHREFKDEGERDMSSKRKRKRHKQKMKLKDKMEMPKLRVLPKREWLELRKEYLQLQKANMAQLKKDMAAITSNGSKDEGGEMKDSKARPTEIPFTEGVVIKFNSNKAFATKRILRELLASIAPIAYIDMKDGDAEGHVRFQTPEGAEQVVQQFCEAGQESKLFTSLLTGEEEKQYWQKMNSDRNTKLNSGKNNKRAKKKGLEKVLSKASRLSTASVGSGSHIRFDDDD
ncbi:la-related protein 7-like [Glandiceps talaboti]